MKFTIVDLRDNENDSETTAMTISVKKTSKKHVTLFGLKSSDTIRYVKVMIQVLEGVPVERQTLVYNGKMLDQDDETLATCNVENLSTIHAMFCPEDINPKVDGVNMIVSVPGWGPIVMEVKPWYTGREIKAVMESAAGFDLDNYVVIHGEKLIEDSMKISECIINMKLPLKLLSLENKFQIIVRGCGWEELILVSESNTVQDVKKMVENFAQLQLHELELFNGDNMVYLDDDEKTLGFYHVEKRSLIWVFGSSSKLSIKMPQVGDTIMLSACEVNSVKDIKHYVWEKMGIPGSSQKLFYKGQLLDEGKGLKSYKMERNSVVYAIFLCGDRAEEVEEGEEICFSFQQQENNLMEFKVTHSYFQKPESNPKQEAGYESDDSSFEIKFDYPYTYSDVKIILESKLDVPISAHQPFCHDRKLKDWETIWDWNITNWSFISSPLTIVIIDTPDAADNNNKLELEVQSSDSIDDVIDMIPHEVIENMVGQPCLFLDGMRLVGTKLLAQCPIQSGSRLCLDRLLQINVTGPNGRITKVDVNPSYKIKAVKEKIEEICGVPYGLQSLTDGRGEVDDDMTLGQYEVLLESLWDLRWKFCRSSWSFFWPSYKGFTAD